MRSDPTKWVNHFRSGKYGHFSAKNIHRTQVSTGVNPTKWVNHFRLGKYGHFSAKNDPRTQLRKKVLTKATKYAIISYGPTARRTKPYPEWGRDRPCEARQPAV